MTPLDPQLIAWFSTYGYIILVPLAIVEGSITGFISGAIAATGVINPFIVFAIIASIRIVTDSAVYFIGRYSRKWLMRIPLFHSVAGKLSSEGGESQLFTFLNAHFSKTLLFAKLSPFPLLDAILIASAGMMHIPPLRVWRIICILQPLLTAMVVALGYYFGVSIHDPRQFIDIFGLVFIAIIATSIFIRRYATLYFSTNSELTSLLKNR